MEQYNGLPNTTYNVGMLLDKLQNLKSNLLAKFEEEHNLNLEACVSYLIKGGVLVEAEDIVNVIELIYGINLIQSQITLKD